MNKSESIAELAKALSKAQGAMKNAVKDSSNPFFKSKYADLAAVADACRAELTANGLAVVHVPETVNGQLTMSYLLMHSSGEWLGASIDMNPVKDDAQGVGSVITYMRRYTLAAVAGVATEDDDGNAASRAGNNGHAQTTKPEPVTFKKSAPTPEKVNPGVSASPGEGEAKTQKGGADPSSVEIPMADCIDKGQAMNFEIEFKNALRPELRKQAKELAHDWLRNQDIKDAIGKPSAYGIKKASFYDVRDEAVRHAKSL